MTFDSVSIIIPALNEERFLAGCLDSIASQDYPREKIEVIVIDNGSVDRTKEIALAHGARFFFNSEMNVSGLRNLGAENARHDILAFVDADCLVHSNWLKSASAYFSDSGTAVWGSPPVLPEDPTWVQKAWFNVRKKQDMIQDVEWLESMNLFIRKEDFDRINGFNRKLETCEDVDLCYRAQKLGRIISDNRIGVIHLGEAGSLGEFFRKEVWRGRSNFRGVLSHGLSLKELPSMMIPVYFLFFLPTLFGGFLTTLKMVWFCLFLFFLLLPSAGVLIRLGKKKISWEELPALLFLVQFYFVARSVALFRRK